MHSAVLLFVSVVLGTGMAQNPIPHRPPRGFVYPSFNCTAPVEFKAFVDLICPYSKQVWPTFLQVAEYYNKGSTSVLSFETLLFPLPYHRAAFPSAQASYILRNLEAQKAYTWFDYIFNKQSKYYNGAILNNTQSEIYEMLASDIATSTGVAKSSILAHFKDSDPSRDEVIVMWKYACSRTVSGTPTVFVNGVRVQFGETWTLADWRKVIDPLLTPDEVGPKERLGNTVRRAPSPARAGLDI